MLEEPLTYVAVLFFGETVEDLLERCLRDGVFRDLEALFDFLLEQAKHVANALVPAADFHFVRVAVVLEDLNTSEDFDQLKKHCDAALLNKDP